MDFEPDDAQRAILEAVQALLARHAGPARAIALASKAEYDAELDAALRDAGFLEIALASETGPLEAALFVEAVARGAGAVSAGASALVGPMLGRYLRAVLAGIEWRITTGQPVQPDQFGRHRWFSAPA